MGPARLNGDRRKAVLCAASCGALAAVPALSISHGHPAVGFVCLGAQVVLLVFAIRFMARGKCGPGG